MKHLYNNPKQKEYRKTLRNNSTEAERLLWHHLRKRQMLGYKFQRQYGVGRFILDFYCIKRRLCIELDGGQHNELTKTVYDSCRGKFLELKKIKVLRFWNNDVLARIEAVLEVIYRELQSAN